MKLHALTFQIGQLEEKKIAISVDSLNSWVETFIFLSTNGVRWIVKIPLHGLRADKWLVSVYIRGGEERRLDFIESCRESWDWAKRNSDVTFSSCLPMAPSAPRSNAIKPKGILIFLYESPIPSKRNKFATGVIYRKPTVFVGIISPSHFNAYLTSKVL